MRTRIAHGSRSVLALVVTAALVLAAVTPALAQKQTVVIYTAIENEQIAEYKKAYEKSLPNIEVKMLRLSTGDIAARFMAEKDNMQADVIWGVGATNMLVFKNAGLLEPYAPKGLERIQPLFRDKANPPSWVGHRHLHVRLLLQHRGRQEEQPAQAGVLGRSHQAGLQGPGGDAQPGLLGHRAISRSPRSCSGWARPRAGSTSTRSTRTSPSTPSPAPSPARTRRRASAPSACRSSTWRSR